jgi:hypothetical protein
MDKKIGLQFPGKEAEQTKQEDLTPIFRLVKIGVK